MIIGRKDAIDEILHECAALERFQRLDRLCRGDVRQHLDLLLIRQVFEVAASDSNVGLASAI